MNLEKRSDAAICKKQTRSYRTIDPWIRKMNAACDYLLENGGCEHDCFGMGYCEKCHEIEKDMK